MFPVGKFKVVEKQMKRGVSGKHTESQFFEKHGYGVAVLKNDALSKSK